MEHGLVDQVASFDQKTGSGRSSRGDTRKTRKVEARSRRRATVVAKTGDFVNLFAPVIPRSNRALPVTIMTACIPFYGGQGVET